MHIYYTFKFYNLYSKINKAMFMVIGYIYLQQIMFQILSIYIFNKLGCNRSIVYTIYSCIKNYPHSSVIKSLLNGYWNMFWNMFCDWINDAMIDKHNFAVLFDHLR